MTFSELYSLSKNALAEAGITSCSFDTICLMEKLLNVTRQDLIVSGNASCSPGAEESFLSAVKKRADGYPLQYIVGKWEFMGKEFFVGEGALIPRDDTEAVVRACLERAGNSKRQKKIVDLCSGTGIIAITVAKYFPAADVYAIELSDEAYHYLTQNIAYHGQRNVASIKGDINKCYDILADDAFDIVISNPPYVESDVIPTLQREVQAEPLKALDGGKDGLDFYRIITKHWLKKLKSGGIIALEIGENQAKAVSEMLSANGISDIEVVKDIQRLDRAIIGTKSC